MKINAKVINKNNNKLLLETYDFRSTELLKQLENNKLYRLDIAEVKSQRSVQQNKLLWQIIDEIATFQAMDSMDIYCELLELANASYEYICCTKEAEQKLRQSFRAVKYIKDVEINGKNGSMYKCFLGSSKMNVKEMNTLIDTAIAYGWELGLDMTVYER